MTKWFASWAALTATAVLFAGLATAQSGLDRTPANLPPPEFDGATFVDNDGCIFVRAGFDGNVTWVPRVTRSREQVCGQTPTFGETVEASAQEAPEPAPSTDPEPLPAPIVTTEPNTAPAPAPAPSAEVATDQSPTIVTPEPEPAPRVTTTQNTGGTFDNPESDFAPVPQDTRETAAVPAPAPAPAPAPRQVATLSQNGQPTQSAQVQTSAPATVTVAPATTSGPVIVSAPRVNTGVMNPDLFAPRYSVTHTTPLRSTGQAVQSQAAAVSRNQWIVPPSWTREDSTPPQVPDGFRAAWDDDRLNPLRGWQRPQGRSQTERLWTNTVPRNAISQSRSATTATAPGFRPVAEAPVVSTQSAATLRAAVTHRPGRFVQAGAFANSANAARAVRRLQSVGLPASTARQGGLQLVLVGPVSSGTSAELLRRTRSAGFRDAFLR